MTNHRISEKHNYHSFMKINCHVDPVVPPRQLALVKCFLLTYFSITFLYFIQLNLSHQLSQERIIVDLKNEKVALDSLVATLKEELALLEKEKVRYRASPVFGLFRSLIEIHM